MNNLDNNFDNSSPWLPLQVKLNGRLVVIVGAGHIALRKAQKIAKTGAKLRVIAHIVPENELKWNLPGIEHIDHNYSGVTDVAGAFLVIAATNDRKLNARIASEARTAGALVLTVDAPENSDIAFPATIRRGALTISFATDCVCPAYAKHLKQNADCHYDYSHAKYLEKVATLKYNPLFKNLSLHEKRHQTQLISVQGNEFKPGSVSIVGAGPGSLGLLTVKAIERLRTADAVIYDALVNPAILTNFAPQAQHINVGKRKSNHTLNQNQINTKLIDLANSGLRILRLKGGDPCLFGRTGEEIRALHNANINVEIIPGISSMTAIPAAIGIPLTDRELGRSVGTFSLHKKNGQPLSNDEWNSMANGPETLVLFMGRGILHEACQQLIARGRSPNLPATMIMNGTLPEQITIIGTLTTLPYKADKELSTGPALIVIGKVIDLVKLSNSYCVDNNAY